MRRLGISVLTALCALSLAACSNESDGDKAPPVAMPAATGPTFHKDVEPILQASCQGCHAPGKIAPFSLMEYSDAKAVASLMALRTSEGVMPPWSATETPDCQPRFGWKDDRRLSKDQLATIKAWSDAGAPEGDPKDAPAATGLPKDDGLQGADLTIEPLKPFVTSGDSDQFRCFVLDPKFTETKFLNATHVLPGNAKVVHHAVIFVDPTGESAQKVDADGGYDCFGGAGLPQAQILSVWTPGAVPNEYPENVGLPVPAGAKLIMQIHYHPAGTTADPDSSKFQLRFTKGLPEYSAFVGAFGNIPTQDSNGDGLQPGPDDPKDGVAFFIPAGTKGHTETMKFTLPLPDPTKPPPPDIKLYSAQTHMHFVGTDMRVTIDRPIGTDAQPASECLIETPNWNFNWQRSYAYNTPIESLPTLRGGDTLTARCVYDNSMDNPFVKRALLEQKLTAPKDVKLGEQTLDEMCIGIFALLVKNN